MRYQPNHFNLWLVRDDGRWLMVDDGWWDDGGWEMMGDKMEYLLCHNSSHNHHHVISPHLPSTISSTISQGGSGRDLLLEERKEEVKWEREKMGDVMICLTIYNLIIYHQPSTISCHDLSHNLPCHLSCQLVARDGWDVSERGVEGEKRDGEMMRWSFLFLIDLSHNQPCHLYHLIYHLIRWMNLWLTPTP